MKPPSRKSAPLGKKLLNALTRDQVAELLDRVFSTLENDKIDAIMSETDPDISAVLAYHLKEIKSSEIFAAAGSGATSKQRLIQNWEALLNEWKEIEFEAGDIEGKYVYQENHWDPPSFMTDDIIDDLEAAANGMLRLLTTVFQNDPGGSDDLIVSLKNISTRIRSLPDWMGADFECIPIGPVTTECVLRWEWLNHEKLEQSAASFIRQAIDRDQDMDLFYLDENGVLEFFSSLPEKAGKEIYADMTDARHAEYWEPLLASPTLKWYRVYHELSRRYSPEQYLRSCRDSIEADWTYGLPLLEHLVTARDYSGAETIALKTVSSFLKMLTDEPWQPEQTLLVDYCRYGGSHQDKKVLSLLKLWAIAARGLDQMQRAAALDLQKIIVRKPFRWDDVVKAFKDVRSHSFADLAGELFHQWQNFVVNHCLVSTKGIKAKDTWIYWLLETGWDESKEKGWFQDRVGRWLERILEIPEQFGKQKELIIIFTQDLTVDSAEKKNYPRLFQFVLWEHVFDRSLKNSRVAWLKKMDGHMFLPRLMECWKKNIGILVPDPSEARKSNYSMHASWMEVVKELNPSVFSDIINRWKIDHARRKNLWVAIKERGLLP